MAKRGRLVLIAALLIGFTAQAALADPKPSEAAPQSDPARPAVGVWIGHVSWNAPIVTYAWSIDADGGFSSGRAGRGPGGGGVWSASGDRVILKYDNGFRYDGELRADVYAGTAYRADGRAFGTFSMTRAAAADAPDKAP